MQIAGYLPTSLIEWPGKIAAVVFTPGCNFRCPFCHNSHLVLPEKIKKVKMITESKILTDLNSRKDWLDLVVVTGGEPTLQKDLANFCRRVKELKIETMIETNGGFPEVVEKLIEERLVDFWAIDFKVPWENYSSLVGNNIRTRDRGSLLYQKVKKSLKIILKSGLAIKVRTTIVPTIHDQKTLIQMTEQLGELVKKHRPSAENFSWQWQDFRSENTLDTDFEQVMPYSSRKIEGFLSGVGKRTSFTIEYNS
ncbi:MAG: anaerobic ribonucleoside-triphosphate reductase activating protein [Patescibacteria group bacterium]|nr:anaerobic ribonucleoside-triphosphate reductase activating protein [Patescibacteria group bacterium]